MQIVDDIKKAISISGEWKEKGDTAEFEAVIAERKAFLSKKKLTYIAKFKVYEDKKEINFTEMLKESGLGLSSGGNMDDMGPGFGFKAGTYSTGFGKPREGTIQEQSDLFGKKYEYKFEWGTFRNTVEEKAKSAGYAFNYKVTGIGL